MTLAPAEFIRRFLIHVLPKGFHRIRRYGLLANGNRVKAIAKVRELLAMEPGKEKSEKGTGEEDGPPKGRTCPCCASPMRIIEVIDRGCTIPGGLVVGEDAELDAQRFERTDNGVCLITREMIDRLPQPAP